MIYLIILFQSNMFNYYKHFNLSCYVILDQKHILLRADGRSFLSINSCPYSVEYNEGIVCFGLYFNFGFIEFPS